jgi:hypothetical protein
MEKEYELKLSAEELRFLIGICGGEETVLEFITRRVPVDLSSHKMKLLVFKQKLLSLQE